MRLGVVLAVTLAVGTNAALGLLERAAGREPEMSRDQPPAEGSGNAGV